MKEISEMEEMIEWIPGYERRNLNKWWMNEMRELK